MYKSDHFMNKATSNILSKKKKPPQIRSFDISCITLLLDSFIQLCLL